MEYKQEKIYKKRTQKDYSRSFKLGIVQEIESGKLSTMESVHKYGIQTKSGTIFNGISISNDLLDRILVEAYLD